MSGKIIQEESECCEKREAVLIMDGVFIPSKNEDKCELECPICYNYCAPPRIPRCENGHLICYLCKCKLTSNLCPVCRAEFVPNRPLVAEAVAKLIPFSCKNAARGCSEQFTWKTKQEHEDNCLYRRYFCPVLTCPGEAGSLNQLKHHVNQKHLLGPGQGNLSLYQNVFATFSTFLTPKLNMMATHDFRFFWWEPQMFIHEFACFLMVFREVDGQNNGTYYFWLWMAANQSEVENFRYRICIEDPAPGNSRDPNYRIGSSPAIDKSILLVNYMATPVSLLMSAEDIQEQNLCLKLTDDQVGNLLTANGPNCDSTCTKGCQHLKYSVLVRKMTKSTNNRSVTPIRPVESFQA
ncbi:E3 ubiquitin-protein ligase SIAH1B [Eurytemora carolleeae]|uniref:E3 ubiquitin-protein ligase SIAH1B n=1 Tax=Eurytemora carolleeae TaxID=1294199 RepID=UPI000C789B7B|nr:E3 ubiquitin-protein ligase SIAH1B [Eurytemora carolleeae]|eukprot:XP_023344613.1 E3 ubiquitin-protein ligase SIAH1B-like [Eurytemora affinis]